VNVKGRAFPSSHLHRTNDQYNLKGEDKARSLPSVEWENSSLNGTNARCGLQGLMVRPVASGPAQCSTRKSETTKSEQTIKSATISTSTAKL
jgi:hypothetical protein